MFKKLLIASGITLLFTLTQNMAFAEELGSPTNLSIESEDFTTYEADAETNNEEVEMNDEEDQNEETAEVTGESNEDEDDEGTIEGDATESAGEYNEEGDAQIDENVNEESEAEQDLPENEEYITKNIRFGWNNDSQEVLKLQTFLNSHLEIGLNINGNYDLETLAAVKVFQSRYKEEILYPWGIEEPTGFVYILTKRKINLIHSPQLDIPMPSELQEFAGYPL